MQVVKAGVLYFALVFGVGFVLGTIRTLLVVPRVGTRKAELMEMPIMLAATNCGGSLDSSALGNGLVRVLAGRLLFLDLVGTAIYPFSQLLSLPL